MNQTSVQSTPDVAHEFTRLCAEGKLTEAQRYWSDAVVSVEAFPGEYQVCRGREATLAKQRAWSASVVMHEINVEGPFINGDQFTVIFEQKCSDLEGRPQNLREVALYTVQDGAIVEERFMPLMNKTPGPEAEQRYPGAPQAA
jgi:SnoaL-like domain